MKKKIKRLASCVATVCLTAVFLSALTNLTERKASDQKYADFFSQKADFDVLFMGTSHVLNAVFPMELWYDYGIVSYNFGGHGNEVATTYWVMENALEQTTPKVVVIDCLAVEKQQKSSEVFSFLHLSLDAFPLNLTKIKAVWDLLDDPVTEQRIAEGKAVKSKSSEPRTKIGLLWDFAVYHSRWNDLGREDFVSAPSLEKGAESRIAVARGKLDRIPRDQKMKPGTTGDRYLRKMIEDCQRRGIDVILTYLPFPAEKYRQKTANYIYDVAEEYGVDYLNFLDLDVIDYQTDLYDEASHLNPSGARKITDYFGRWLTEHYGIPDRREDPEYASWHGDYDQYAAMKNRNLTERKDLYEYLMLLKGDDLEIRMDIRNGDLFRDEWILDQLANLGADRDSLSPETSSIFIRNRGRDVEIKGVDESGPSEEDGADLQIDVWRGEDQIDSASFSYGYDPETGHIAVSSVER